MLMGDYNSAHAKLLKIEFEKCYDEPDTPDDELMCQTDEEINNWMIGKYIVLLENAIAF